LGFLQFMRRLLSFDQTSRICALIPTKQQFLELAKASDSDRLSASLKLVFGNESESKIRGIIEGYDRTLKTAFLNYVSPLPAYKWLSDQQGFVIAQRRVFPEGKTDWLDNEVAGVMQQTEENLKLGPVSLGERKTLFRKLMWQVAHRMQLRPRWMGMVSKCLCAYHYPASPHLGKMRGKTIEAGRKIEAARQAISEISEFSEFIPGLLLPDQDLVYKMGALADFLKPGNISEFTPIKRADSSFMERLFVIHLANGHSSHLQCSDGMPAVIADLFYLEGIANALDERTVRRICSDQEQRRNKALLAKAQPSDALIGQLIAKK
jgi:hypothetical protein